MECGLDENCNTLRKLDMLKGNLITQQEQLDSRQNIYKNLDETVNVVKNAFDSQQWLTAVVVKNDNLSATATATATGRSRKANRKGMQVLHLCVVFGSFSFSCSK